MDKCPYNYSIQCVCIITFIGGCCQYVGFSYKKLPAYISFNIIAIICFLFRTDKIPKHNTKSGYSVCCNDGHFLLFIKHKFLPKIAELPGRKTAGRPDSPDRKSVV